MSTNMRGLLCEGVMIWVPSDLSDGELSNESQYEGAIVWGGVVMGTTGFVSRKCFKWVPIWGVYCVRGWCYGYHWICLIESFQMSPNMRGWCYGYHWICLIESFQMSPNTRGLLCEEVMIWVPSDLSDGELSNESQYEGASVWGGDVMGTTGFVSRRAFKWVRIWGVYCVRGWRYRYHWLCLIESFQMSPNMRGLLCVRVMIWVPPDLSDGALSNKSTYEGSIVWHWGGDAMGTIGFVSLRAFKWVPIWGVYCVRGWCYG